jgi:hypothetical protein
VSKMTDETEVVETPEAAPEAEAAPESTWNWNNELPGTGEAPDWLNTAKYNDVSEQAKAYRELESKFGGFTGAPEAYEATLPEDLVLPEGVQLDFNNDDPIFQAIAPVAAELNMSQEGLNKIVGAYFGATAHQMQQDAISDREYIEKELASVPQGQQRINQMAAWAKSNLPEDQFEAFSDAVVDAKTMLMFETLINKTRNAPLPTVSEAQTRGYSQADVDAAFREKDQDGNNKYLTDPAHRAKVERMMQQTR